MPQKIVLTGAPGTGKTTVFNLLSNLSYTCFPEISREVIKEQQQKGRPNLFKSNPYLFSKILLEKRIQQFNHTINTEIAFYDRGIHDVLAYMQHINHPTTNLFYQQTKEYNYQKVFVFPPWIDIYRKDNERMEHFSECESIHQNILLVYTNSNTQIITVPKLSPDERVEFIISKLNNTSF